MIFLHGAPTIVSDPIRNRRLIRRCFTDTFTWPGNVANISFNSPHNYTFKVSSSSSLPQLALLRLYRTPRKPHSNSIRSSRKRLRKSLLRFYRRRVDLVLRMSTTSWPIASTRLPVYTVAGLLLGDKCSKCIDESSSSSSSYRLDKSKYSFVCRSNFFSLFVYILPNYNAAATSVHTVKDHP